MWLWRSVGARPWPRLSLVSSAFWQPRSRRGARYVSPYRPLPEQTQPVRRVGLIERLSDQRVAEYVAREVDLDPPPSPPIIRLSKRRE